MIFINEYRGRFKFENYYYIIAFSLALLLSLLSITGNMYGYDIFERYIWGDPQQKVASGKSHDFEKIITKLIISSVVRRIVWYPVIPLVTQAFGSSAETYIYIYHMIPLPLFLLWPVGTSLQGIYVLLITDSLVFSQDIAVTHVFQSIKLQLWISIVNSYESHYPHRSYNKAITDEFCIPEEFNDFVELKILDRNKIDIIINNDIINNDIINNDIINDNIINNNIIINNVTNNHSDNIIVNRVNNNNNNNNNNLILQPSILEWLKYMLLIKLFTPPKSSFRLFSPKLLSPINSFSGINSSSLFGRNNLKQDITPKNQDDHLVLPEPIHLKSSFQYSSLDLSPHCLNLSISSDHLIDSSRSHQTNISNINNTI
ncbi:hypothetical protein F8M41_017794 [Gigaspora margarita]|uniref:Uncharacterized protein n=1 Tax=Gigaspora margarita TaxID=4874 RepID=A0A8H4AMH4_GIGMA|nr:hypothetical protein F8M41_017794 [Gigaspora margarita]